MSTSASVTHPVGNIPRTTTPVAQPRSTARSELRLLYVQGVVVFQEVKSTHKVKPTLAVVLLGARPELLLPLELPLDRRVSHLECPGFGELIKEAVAKDGRLERFDVQSFAINIGPTPLSCSGTQGERFSVFRLAKGELERELFAAEERVRRKQGDEEAPKGIAKKIDAAKEHGERCFHCATTILMGRHPVQPLQINLSTALSQFQKRTIQSALQRVVRVGAA